MEDRNNESPKTGANANIEQSQAGQQPPTAQQPQQPETSQQQGQSGQAQQPPETSQQGQPGEQSGEQPGHLGQSEAMTEQKNDIEGSGGSPAAGQTPSQPSGFVGSEGSSDTSSELVEDDDFAKNGQGTPEGE